MEVGLGRGDGAWTSVSWDTSPCFSSQDMDQASETLINQRNLSSQE